MQALLNAIAHMALPTDAQRIFHGRGGLHPGCEQWTLDAYPPVLLLTSFEPATDDELAAIGAALEARWAQVAPGNAADIRTNLRYRTAALRVATGVSDDSIRRSIRHEMLHLAVATDLQPVFMMTADRLVCTAFPAIGT